MGKKKKKQDIPLNKKNSLRPRKCSERREDRLSFRLIAIIIIPCLFLLFLEGVLNLFQYGYRTQAIKTCQVDGRTQYCDNNQFSLRFLSESTARKFQPFVFDRNKSEDTYRIFVLGGSAALGDLASEYSFARILEVMLKEEFPQVKFEIVNLGMTAINSHVVLEIAKEVVSYQPDLFIIYMGNNEIVGPYGAGTVFTPVLSKLSLIRTHIFVRKTKVGQLLSRFISGIVSSGKESQSWRGMTMFLDKQVRADDPALQYSYKNFKHNLEDILKIIIRKSNVPVV